jgi:hypothetical protein
MKWKKTGKIFDPSEFSLPNGCIEFAQSPQTLVFDDFIRIYFSTRQKDMQTGKFLSHIAFVDVDKLLFKVLRVSTKSVIKLGGLGHFDQHGIFPINPVRAEGKILAYTTGWNRRVSVSVDTSVGLAISNDDGETFEKVGNGPILTSSLYEPFLVGDAFVRYIEKTYHMWYIYGVRWIDNEVEESARVYKIAHATSSDGCSWIKEGKQIISDKLNSDECQALPSVVYFENRYHMFFCYREAIDFRKNKERAYRIGHAFSDDLKNWVRDDDQYKLEVTNDDWDSDMLCYPHVFSCDGKIFMLYNGNEFGRYGFGMAVLE